MTEPLHPPTSSGPESVSVVIPCFNEGSEISRTLESVRRALEEVAEVELVVVDDGSSDETPDVLQTLSEAYQPRLQVIRHPRNRGYGAALKSGIRRASHEWIIIIDSDGTYPADDLPRLLHWAGPCDMVVGSRTGSDVTYPLLRRIPKVFLKAFASWIAGQTIPDINSGMRVFRRRQALEFFHVLPDGFSFTTTITLALLTHHYSVGYLPINYEKRVGRSKIRPISDTVRFIQLILRTGIYFAPLRIFAPIIFVLTTAFIASITYDTFVLRNLTDKTMMMLVLTMNAVFFAFIADMIDKRSP